MSDPGTRDPGRVRVTSWNVHGAVGRDGRCRPERILDHLRRLCPDIAALQEIDGRAHFGRREDAFETFAAGLGSHVAEARLVRRPRRDYGHLLWSRWPIARERLRLLPGGRFEPRGAIDAVVDAPGGPLRVIAAHFGLLRGDRRRQAEAVARFVGEEDLPTIVLGDFNEWGLSGPVHARLSPVVPIHVSPKTWPSRHPLARMDRLYATPGIFVEDVSLDRHAGPASDHLPLSAVLRPFDRSG